MSRAIRTGIAALAAQSVHGFHTAYENGAFVFQTHVRDLFFLDIVSSYM